jgi:hypothetical protein
VEPDAGEREQGEDLPGFFLLFIPLFPVAVQGSVPVVPGEHGDGCEGGGRREFSIDDFSDNPAWHL